MSSGHAQLGFADTPVAAYQVKQSHGKFKLVGAAYAPAPYGIAIAKSTGLAPAVKAAMVYLIKNGTYGTIFKKWGVAEHRDPRLEGEDQRRDQLAPRSQSRAAGDR